MIPLSFLTNAVKIFIGRTAVQVHFIGLTISGPHLLAKAFRLWVFSFFKSSSVQSVKKSFEHIERAFNTLIWEWNLGFKKYCTLCSIKSLLVKSNTQNYSHCFYSLLFCKRALVKFLTSAYPTPQRVFGRQCRLAGRHGGAHPRICRLLPLPRHWRQRQIN